MYEITRLISRRINTVLLGLTFVFICAHELTNCIYRVVINQGNLVLAEVLVLFAHISMFCAWIH